MLHTVEMELADATESVDGKAVKEQVTILEMKTFKRNFRSLSQYDRLEETTQVDSLRITCVGAWDQRVSSSRAILELSLNLESILSVALIST